MHAHAKSNSIQVLEPLQKVWVLVLLHQQSEDTPQPAALWVFYGIAPVSVVGAVCPWLGCRFHMEGLGVLLLVWSG